MSSLWPESSGRCFGSLVRLLAVRYCNFTRQGVSTTFLVIKPESEVALSYRAPNIHVLWRIPHLIAIIQTAILFGKLVETLNDLIHAFLRLSSPSLHKVRLKKLEDFSIQKPRLDWWARVLFYPALGWSLSNGTLDLFFHNNFPLCCGLPFAFDDCIENAVFEDWLALESLRATTRARCSHEGLCSSESYLLRHLAASRGCRFGSRRSQYWLDWFVLCGSVRLLLLTLDAANTCCGCCSLRTTVCTNTVRLMSDAILETEINHLRSWLQKVSVLCFFDSGERDVVFVPWQRRCSHHKAISLACSLALAGRGVWLIQQAVRALEVALVRFLAIILEGSGLRFATWLHQTCFFSFVFNYVRLNFWI